MAIDYKGKQPPQSPELRDEASPGEKMEGEMLVSSR